jgi:pimeloyl-ACP methyl ester carboxylesterase
MLPSAPTLRIAREMSTNASTHCFVTINGRSLEVVRIAGRAAQPTLVMLHEGLGSVSVWRDFPQRVAAATGCPTIVYSRANYGRSQPLGKSYGVDFMHREALEVLPALLDELHVRDPVLLGHSDGGSIALIHAGAGLAVRALIVMAPHVMVEDVSVSSIEKAREAYATTDLRAKLARHHDNVDAAFRGWNDIWLAPAFRGWNIEGVLEGIKCPVLAIQGEDDEYGSMAQIDSIARYASGPVQLLKLAACGHSPHRDQPEKTLDAIRAFLAS